MLIIIIIITIITILISTLPLRKLGGHNTQLLKVYRGDMSTQSTNVHDCFI